MRTVWSGIPKRGRGDAEASFAQERLWLMEKLAPGACMFNMLNGLMITGSLDQEALGRSIAEIMRRHESLRTNLVYSGGRVLQRVSPEPPASLETVDLSGIPREERLAEAGRRARALAGRPYDLAADPLFRTVLYGLGDGRHLLAIFSHHAAFDGWSFRLFENELGAIYSAHVDGGKPPLPEPPIQYGDYSQWQRARFEAGDFASEVEYWKGVLGGELPVLELPTDWPRGNAQEYEGGAIRFALSKEVSEGLGSRARGCGCSLYMVLLAAFFVFLHRYTGADDIIVGCPVAGRGMAELEGLLGFFVNTLPIRANFSGDPTFSEFLKQVKRRTLEAYARQDLSFDKIVGVVRPERDLSHSPVYQVLFQLRNFPLDRQKPPRISMERYDFGWATAQVELFVDMEETAGGILFRVEYPKALFRKETMERMARHLGRLLGAVAEGSDARVSRLPLMTEEELETILVSWNMTETEYPRSKCVHQIFEERAEEAPEAVAVKHGGQSLAYRELNSRANQLARVLLKEGAEPGTPVGVCLERSIGMVVACLAILKAGCAYAPLDPNDPPRGLA